jgi:NADPH:quinone reductase-like Zn-dependent oxidoreductase
MKTWRFHEFGKIENLRPDETPIPEPAPGEALIKIAYAALNPADQYLVCGKYPRAGKPPFAVGRDGSGTVERVHPGSRFKVGDQVVILRSEVGVAREGTLAEYVTVPEESLALLPAGWTLQEGAAAPLVNLTAWQALVEEGQLKAGQTVLITGASGGVGTASLVQAKALGARVVCLSRSAAKRQRLLELGADFAFDSEDPDLVKHVQEALGGGRADVVVENLAGPFLQKSIQMTGTKGRICVVGLLAGLKSEIIIGTFIFKRIHIVGIAIGNWTPGEVQAAWAGITELFGRTGHRPMVDRVFGFDQVQEAFAYMAGGPLGKVLVGPMG